MQEARIFLIALPGPAARAVGALRRLASRAASSWPPSARPHRRDDHLHAAARRGGVAGCHGHARAAGDPLRRQLQHGEHPTRANERRGRLAGTNYCGCTHSRPTPRDSSGYAARRNSHAERWPPPPARTARSRSPSAATRTSPRLFIPRVLTLQALKPAPRRSRADDRDRVARRRSRHGAPSRSQAVSIQQHRRLRRRHPPPRSPPEQKRQVNVTIRTQPSSVFKGNNVLHTDDADASRSPTPATTATSSPSPSPSASWDGNGAGP